ncbi:MAG: hypothetical protein QME14_00605 [Methanobacteriaceae archaeon]|nr:hypothetical protein [Methanobacteriaceae archaeon]
MAKDEKGFDKKIERMTVEWDVLVKPVCLKKKNPPLKKLSVDHVERFLKLIKSLITVGNVRKKEVIL